MNIKKEIAKAKIVLEYESLIAPSTVKSIIESYLTKESVCNIK